MIVDKSLICDKKIIEEALKLLNEMSEKSENEDKDSTFYQIKNLIKQEDIVDEYTNRHYLPIHAHAYDKLCRMVNNDNSDEYQNLLNEDKSKLNNFHYAIYASFEKEINTFLNKLDNALEKSNGQCSKEIHDLIVGCSISLIKRVLDDWNDYKTVTKKVYDTKLHVCHKLLKNAWGRYTKGMASLIERHRRNFKHNWQTDSFDESWKYTFNKLDENTKKFMKNII